MIKCLKILWDPGHGGNDPGAVNDDTLQAPLLIEEEDITLSLVQLAIEYAKATFVNIINETTRFDDRNVSLEDRVKMCWPTTPNLFFSVHINSRPKELPESVGIEYESYFWSGLTAQSDSAAAAKIILEKVLKAGAEAGQKVINRGVKQANFYVLRNTPCPSVLMEAGFESDKDDVIWFSDLKNRKAVAKGLAEGAASYFESKGFSVERWI